MSPIRITTVLAVSLLICVSSAISVANPAQPPPTPFPGGGGTGPGATSPLTQEVKQLVLDHYAANIAGAKSFSSNPRKAAEALKKLFEDFRGRLAAFGNTIDRTKAAEMLNDLKSQARAFFQANQASSKDWRQFFLDYENSAPDPTVKKNWEDVLDGFIAGFDEVANLILQEEFKVPFKENVGITPARAAPGAAGTAAGGASGILGGHAVRRTVRRGPTGWSVEYEKSGPFHRVTRKRSYKVP